MISTIHVSSHHGCQRQPGLQDIRCLQVAQHYDHEIALGVEAVVREKAIDMADMIDEPALGFRGDEPAIAVAQVLMQ